MTYNSLQVGDTLKKLYKCNSVILTVYEKNNARVEIVDNQINDVIGNLKATIEGSDKIAYIEFDTKSEIK